MTEPSIESMAGKLTCINNAQLASTLAHCISTLSCDVYTVDLRMSNTQEDALTLIAKKCAFPDYFDANLDALYDVLSEKIDDTQSANQTWLIRSTPKQAKLLFPTFDTLRDAFSEAQGTQLTLLWWVDESE